MGVYLGIFLQKTLILQGITMNFIFVKNPDIIFRQDFSNGSSANFLIGGNDETGGIGRVSGVIFLSLRRRPEFQEYKFFQ
jgi:hypothetical protein